MNSIIKNRWLLGTVMMILAILLMAAAFPLAGAPVQAEETVASPDEEGPYNVGWYLTRYIDSEYGGYNAIIYYPAKWNGWRAKKDTTNAAYPGIIVANGYF